RPSEEPPALLLRRTRDRHLPGAARPVIRLRTSTGATRSSARRTWTRPRAGYRKWRLFDSEHARPLEETTGGAAWRAPGPRHVFCHVRRPRPEMLLDNRAISLVAGAPSHRYR